MNKNHLREQMALLLPADVKERVIIGVDKIVCGVCHSPVVDYCESPNNYEEPKYWEDGKEFGVSIFYLCTGCSVAYAVGDLRGTEKDIYRLQEQFQRDKGTALK
ncbi:hypothetical protein MHH70_01725 [Metasolibacillus sp. FSL H7-0170]|uniref:hypothetical protein n=1 Tax=Metasolibacillus sp. FSL H7-0170 TaxID=2921431 RepID=UPI0007997E80|nr:hypothetical protein A0U40_03625 [[Bacillus] sp. KCTC 13219]